MEALFCGRDARDILSATNNHEKIEIELTLYIHVHAFQGFTQSPGKGRIPSSPTLLSPPT